MTLSWAHEQIEKEGKMILQEIDRLIEAILFDNRKPKAIYLGNKEFMAFRNSTYLYTGLPLKADLEYRGIPIFKVRVDEHLNVA